MDINNISDTVSVETLLDDFVATEWMGVAPVSRPRGFEMRAEDDSA